MSQLILILEDSELVAGMLEMICAQLGYRTVCAYAFADVAAKIAGESPAVIISDLNLPDAPGKDPISALRGIPSLSTTPTIIISGIAQSELDAIAAERGAQGAISKDAGMPGMMTRLQQLLPELTG
ncbi:MAG: response regulator [Myxococcota bacterium]